MIHQTTCDRCGKPVSIKWTTEDIKSMEALKVDWKGIEGRCEACEEQILIEHGYVKPQAEARPQEPLTEEEVRQRIPLSMQTAIPFPARRERIGEGAVYVSPDDLFPK